MGVLLSDRHTSAAQGRGWGGGGGDCRLAFCRTGTGGCQPACCCCPGPSLCVVGHFLAPHLSCCHCFFPCHTTLSLTPSSHSPTHSPTAPLPPPPCVVHLCSSLRRATWPRCRCCRCSSSWWSCVRVGVCWVTCTSHLQWTGSTATPRTSWRPGGTRYRGGHTACTACTACTAQMYCSLASPLFLSPQDCSLPPSSPPFKVASALPF